MGYKQVVQPTEERISGASNFAALRALAPAYQQGVVVVEGGVSPGDGLGGPFWFDTTSTLADESLNTLNPTSNPSTGRWRRIASDARYQQVFSAEKNGLSTTALDTYNTSALQYTMDEADAAGGGIVLLPDGSCNISGGLTQPETVILQGSGTVSSQLNHTGDNTAITSLAFELFRARGWRGFRLIGNSGASAKGIVFGNSYGAIFDDIFVYGYTNGTGIQPTITTHWTEGTRFNGVQVRDCLKTMAFVVDPSFPTPPGSFSDTRFEHCLLVGNIANAKALDIGANCLVYGSSFDLKLHLDTVSTATAMNVAGTAILQDNRYGIIIECFSGGTGVVTASGAKLDGHGDIRVIGSAPHSLSASSTVNISPQFKQLTRGMFRAKSGLGQSIPDNASTKVNFDTEVTDELGWFVPGTGGTQSRYTPQQAGWYMLGGAVLYGSSVDQRHVRLIFWGNGVDEYPVAWMPSSGTSLMEASGTTPVYANGSTDYFELATYHNFGVATALYAADSKYTYFWGYRLP